MSFYEPLKFLKNAVHAHHVYLAIIFLLLLLLLLQLLLLFVHDGFDLAEDVFTKTP